MIDHQNKVGEKMVLFQSNDHYMPGDIVYVI